MPVLARVGDADRLAVLDDVREIADLGHAGLVVPAGERGLDLAEAPGEVSELDSLEPLAGKAQHAVPAETFQNCREVRVAQGFREVHPRTVAPRICPLGSMAVMPSSSPLGGIILRRVR